MRRDSENVFETIPELPVVPKPAAGETLASWLTAIARVYGLTLREYLLHIGIPPGWIGKALERDLRFELPSGIQRSIQRGTGVGAKRIRLMTFAELPRDLQPFRDYCQPCAACLRALSRRHGRPVDLLKFYAPWRIGCVEHPPDYSQAEISPEVPIEALCQAHAGIDQKLESAVQSRISGEKSSNHFFNVPLSLFVDFVHAVNSYVFLRIVNYDSISEDFKFSIEKIFSFDENFRPIQFPEGERNNLQISLIFANQAFLDIIRLNCYSINYDYCSLEHVINKADKFAYFVIEYFELEMICSVFAPIYKQGGNFRGKARDVFVDIYSRRFMNNKNYESIRSEIRKNYTIFSRALINVDVGKIRRFSAGMFSPKNVFQYLPVQPKGRYRAEGQRLSALKEMSLAGKAPAGLRRFSTQPPGQKGRSKAKPPAASGPAQVAISHEAKSQMLDLAKAVIAENLEPDVRLSARQKKALAAAIFRKIRRKWDARDL